MNRDLFTDPYGRFYYLPHHLAELGHECHVLCLDYKRSSSENQDVVNTRWYTESIYNRFGFGYLSKVNSLVKTIKPDFIIGFSDMFYGIFAHYLAKKHGARYLIDAYDNYESYFPSCWPLHFLWRRALKKADALTAAGPSLLKLMSIGNSNAKTAVVPMAVDTNKYTSLDKDYCRSQLGLDSSAKLIGYFGAIHSTRGLDILYRAFVRLQRNLNADVRLILSGRKSEEIPDIKGIHYLGFVSNHKMPLLYNAVDLLVVPNQKSSFGQHSYPIKLLEALQCGTPVLAAKTNATEWMLNSMSPNALYECGSCKDLYKKIVLLLNYSSNIEIYPSKWQSSALVLNDLLSNYGSLYTE